jgi:hypothetical protein
MELGGGYANETRMEIASGYVSEIRRSRIGVAKHKLIDCN